MSCSTVRLSTAHCLQDGTSVPVLEPGPGAVELPRVQGFSGSGLREETDLPVTPFAVQSFLPAPALRRSELLYFQREQFSSGRNCANSPTIYCNLKDICLPSLVLISL